jgi:hypothetical protein
MKRTGWLAASAVVLAFCASQANAAVAHLTLQSQPEDFVGGGKSSDITYDTANGATVSAQVRRSLAGAPAELLFVLDAKGASNTFATVFFGTDALGIPMQAGTYTNAERSGFAAPGHPGLDISFQNRGSNMVTGQFTVTGFSYSNGAIQSFSASFEQHSEGETPALFGKFTYAANPVPEPASLGLLVMGSVLLAGRRGPRA